MNTTTNSSAPNGGHMRSYGDLFGPCVSISPPLGPDTADGLGGKAADGAFRSLEAAAFTGCDKP